jgi:hypothetical protein
MDWQADSIQGVIFVAPGEAQEDAISLWGTVFGGESPDGFQKVTASPTVVTHATGLRDGNPITLMSQLGRIDILAGPGPAVAPAPNSPPPRIDDVPTVASRVTDYLMRLTKTCRPIRAALVLDLSSNVERGRESDRLQTALPGVFPVGATEPHFQFNVPRPFEALPDLQMNRLCTYTGGEMGFIMMGSPPALGGGPIATTPYIGLRIDVNSAADNRIPTGKADEVILELLREALIIRDEQISRFQ